VTFRPLLSPDGGRNVTDYPPEAGPLRSREAPSTHGGCPETHSARVVATTRPVTPHAHADDRSLFVRLRLSQLSAASETSIGLLADRPDLVAQVGEMRWREWGHGETSREDWIDVTVRESGRDDPPVTLVALDDRGNALGAVGLDVADDALTEEERRSRQPWLLGLVVRSDRRHEGIGGRLVAALEDLSRARLSRGLGGDRGRRGGVLSRVRMEAARATGSRQGWVDQRRPFASPLVGSGAPHACQVHCQADEWRVYNDGRSPVRRPKITVPSPIPGPRTCHPSDA